MMLQLPPGQRIHPAEQITPVVFAPVSATHTDLLSEYSTAADAMTNTERAGRAYSTFCRIAVGGPTEISSVGMLMYRSG